MIYVNLFTNELTRLSWGNFSLIRKIKGEIKIKKIKYPFGEAHMCMYRSVCICQLRSSFYWPKSCTNCADILSVTGCFCILEKHFKQRVLNIFASAYKCRLCISEWEHKLPHCSYIKCIWIYKNWFHLYHENKADFK